MYLQFIVVCLYIMRPRPRGARYSVCVPSLAPPGEARHHLLKLPGIFLRQLRHHLADLVLDARVHGAGHRPASTSGASILICFPMSSQGPLFMAQSIWDLMKVSSLSFSSVMRLVAAQDTGLSTLLTPCTTVSSSPGSFLGGGGGG